jgi:hypothetical protein
MPLRSKFVAYIPTGFDGRSSSRVRNARFRENLSFMMREVADHRTELAVCGTGQFFDGLQDHINSPHSILEAINYVGT